MRAYYDVAMQLEAFLYFDGRCEEALEFYKAAIGGEYDVTRFAGSPAASHAGPDWGDKILHSTFRGDGFTFMASDRMPGEGEDPNPNVALSLSLASAEQAQGVFERLAGGGRVMMPFEHAFWGGKFGMVTDRFGIEWMISGGSG